MLSVDEQGTIVDFKSDKRDLVVKAMNGSDMVQGLLFERLPTYLVTMSRANLQSVRDCHVHADPSPSTSTWPRQPALPADALHFS